MPKSKYETHVLPYLERIEKWVTSGATAKEVAKKLHISYSSFRKYIDDGEKGNERYSALSTLYTRACDVPDDEVEASLYKLCNGYNAPVVKNFKIKKTFYDPDTGKKVREVEELVQGVDEVQVQANVTAQMFWLANRRPQNWKYKPTESDKDSEEDASGVIELAPVIQPPPPPEVAKE